MPVRDHELLRAGLIGLASHHELGGLTANFLLEAVKHCIREPQHGEDP
jgi:hypothetical protein